MRAEEGTRRVQLVREGGTRRVQLVREGRTCCSAPASSAARTARRSAASCTTRASRAAASAARPSSRSRVSARAWLSNASIRCRLAPRGLFAARSPGARLVRGEGRGVSTEYEGRDETCPLVTGGRGNCHLAERGVGIARLREARLRLGAPCVRLLGSLLRHLRAWRRSKLALVKTGAGQKR